jgi:hypothetical protein
MTSRFERRRAAALARHRPRHETAKPPDEPVGDGAAFRAQTDLWIAELEEECRRTKGAEMGPFGGVRFAGDHLVHLHGDRASWSRFDVTVFEHWVREHTPEVVVALPFTLAELACFTDFLARHRRMSSGPAALTCLRALLTLPEPGVVKSIVQRPAGTKERGDGVQ